MDYYTQQGLIPIDGKKIQYVIEPDGLNGTLYIAGFRIGTFTWLGNALEGGVGIRRYSTRNNILDDFRIIQEDSSGQEIILFEDDFNRISGETAGALSRWAAVWMRMISVSKMVCSTILRR